MHGPVDIAMGRLRPEAVVREHVTYMVEDDVEDDIQAELVCGIHKRSQFLIRLLRVVGKVPLGSEEVVNAVAVIDLREREMQVLKNWAQPDGPDAETLQVR
jgi:hypothetical protein